ncbi:TonB-dependent receptor [Sphingomonas sp. PB4P5]|uniref:TonB-dependent receptor n=1 Tax=Parasphingomonas puruogangriensis TaxID=3096155 RepID=UPI002FC81CE3
MTDEDSWSETDIIVTAQKRDERIQDVPIAISVVGAHALTRSGAKNLIELQGAVPGVFFSGNAIGGSAPIAIRGVSGVNTYLLDDPVALYVNGVYQSSGQFGSSGFLDIGSIEVVRGPQGTLQGRNATAGAVLIKTADTTSKLSGYARASIADPLEYRGEGAISGPLGPTLQLRLAANFYRERGWGDNVFDGSHIGGGHGYSFRGTLRWQPAEAVVVRLIAGRNHTYSEPALARYAATSEPTSSDGPLQPPGTLTPTTPLSKAQRGVIEDDLQFALNRHTFSRIVNDSLALDATYDLGGAELASVTGYDRIENTSFTDIDSFARTDREGFVIGDVPTRNFSEELRLQSTGSPRLSYIIGLYYAHSDQDLDSTSFNLRLTSSVPTAARFIASQRVASYAGFADATLRLTDTVSATAGIRHTRETKSFDLLRILSNAETGQPLASPADYRPPRAEFANTSIRAKLIYRPTSHLLAYASFSTGFKSGGFNAFGTDPAFRPETLKSLEGGVKASLLKQRVTFAFAAYANHFDDMQVRYGLPIAGLGIANAANSKIKGFELEGTAHVLRDLTLAGSLAYTNGRFRRFDNALDLLSRPVDASGNRLPRTPSWQYSLHGSYAPRLAADMLGVIDVSWKHRGLVYLYQTDQNSPTVQGQAVGELGMRAGITFEREQLSATIFANNLNNGRSANGLNVAFSYPSVTFNKPRSVGLQFEKKF